MENNKSLLIYAPVPLYHSEAGLLLEDQACNGLRLWAENFEKVYVLMPVMYGTPPASWCPIQAVGDNLNRIEIIPLPTAYRPDQFFRHYFSTRRLIRDHIGKADYLSFSIGGLFGDWGSVACFQAHRMGRPYAVWTDRVESEVVRRLADVGHWRKRLRARLTHRPMAWLEKFLIRRAALGLFHGKETFDTYAPYCRKPEIVHDIHINKSEHISPQALNLKVGSANQGPLKIAYVGRADAMKGSLEWAEVLKKLAQFGVDFKACWLGEGPELLLMKKQIKVAGLQDRVELPGYTNDRKMILNRLRDAHIFLFCHKTPESPRCLIEALVSGTPIVGYDGAFAQDLISGGDGGLLSDLGDTSELSRNVEDLNRNRDKLAAMIAAAAKAGAKFDDESVFRHRSELIYRYL